MLYILYIIYIYIYIHIYIYIYIIIFGSSNLRHFRETAIYNVSKCQYFEAIFCSVIEGLVSCM